MQTLIKGLESECLWYLKFLLDNKFNKWPKPNNLIHHFSVAVQVETIKLESKLMLISMKRKSKQSLSSIEQLLQIHINAKMFFMPCLRLKIKNQQDQCLFHQEALL